MENIEEKLGNIEESIKILKSNQDEIKEATDEIYNLPTRTHLRLGFEITNLIIAGTFAFTSLSLLKLDKIMNNYQDFSKIQTENVIGNKAPEKFYEVDGKRVYLEIDGKPVADYFKKGDRK